jgi:membrane carboxypeptidase/penicillin-binding protein
VATAALPTLVAYNRARRDAGFQFTDYLGREARSTGAGNLTANSYTVRSTINVPLQRALEATLQDGLAHYEQGSGRMHFQGPEANLAEAVRRIAADKTDKTAAGTEPAWQQALESLRLPLYDVHWTPAVVVEKGGRKKGDDTIRVGLRDGRVVPLTAWTGEIRRSLALYDVVYVYVIEPKAAAKGKAGGKPPAGARAQLRVRPTVQGAAIVLENKTGRILAMAGSFSYPLSQLNRAAQSQRQPGSALKPLTYLAALQHGLQPNTLVLDQPITLPPVGTRDTGRGGLVISREPPPAGRDEDYWTPKNADNSSGGIYTLRRGLENSRNIVTARLLDGGIEAEPEQSLDRVCGLALEAKLYSECVRYYPFVLGAQPVRLIDLAAFYAAVANEGARPSPHAIDAIEQDGRTIYQRPADPPPRIGSADRTAFYQLKTMLQGVVERGTARAIRGLAPYVAGKTGTTDNAVDAWFMGFTNDVTVGVWVGYDNADGKRRSLGPGATGARVAIPIFEPIMQAVWGLKVAPKVALSGPSREAQRRLVDLQIDLGSGDRVTGGRGFVEHFRLDADGRFTETQYQLVSREEAYGWRGRDSQGDGEWMATNQGFWVRPFGDNGYWSNRSYAPFSGWQAPPQPQPPARGLFGQPRFDDQEDARQRARRRDPDYFWGGGRYN